MSHRYFCHACQAYQQVVMTPAPACSVCHSQFIEQVASQEATTHNVDIDNELSERLNHTTLGEACHSRANSQHTSDNHSDIVTDDQDEDYEDIDSDDDYEDDDYDEQDEISAFIESHRHESRYHHHYYDQDEWDYDIDRYYDEILDYNPSSDYYDGMDEFTSPWSSYYVNPSNLTESNHTWENFLRAMFWQNEDQDRPTPATQSDIDQLEKRQFKEGDAEADIECSICQENFGVNNEIMILPCKHEYHGSCIRQWLQISATCPMCRCTIISQEEIQRRRRRQEPQVTSHPNSLGGRTFTLTSADQRHAIGIMVADVSSLPHPPYLGEDFDYYDDYDELEDEYDDDEYNDSEDEWDQVDQQEPISQEWRHHHTHGPLFICPHGHLVSSFNRLRRAPTETAHSTPVAEFHQPNPMDEVD